MTHPIVFSSAADLAERIRRRELGAREVTQAFLDQISAQNEAVGAIVLRDDAGALQRAEEADRALARGELWGPLHGVPITVKDSFSTRGLRTTAGHAPLARHVPDDDASPVRLLREAGAILLGKTNLATLAMDMQTVNPLFGRTRNPWNVERTTGGSSGGCVAALASGMTPLSLGSDLAGSIRLPSAYVGVYGLKPSQGAVPFRGHLPPLPGEIDGIRGLAVAGPMARSVEDLELALGVLTQRHARDACVRPLRALERAPLAVSELRIAYAKRLGGVRVSQDVADAIERTAASLRSAGARVVEAEPPDLSYDETWETWGAIVGMQGGYEQSSAMRWLGSKLAARSVQSLPMHRRILDPICVSGYMSALAVQDRQIDALDRFMSEHDAWIVPASATTAFPHHEPSRTFGIFNVYDRPLSIDGQPLHYYLATQAYTTLFSVTESPVVSMPVGLDRDGLPVGVQVVGRRSEDVRLLRTAALIAHVVERPAFPLEPRSERALEPSGPAERRAVGGAR